MSKSIPPMAAGAKCVVHGVRWTLFDRMGIDTWSAISGRGAMETIGLTTWQSAESHTPAPPVAVERPLADGWTKSSGPRGCSRCGIHVQSGAFGTTDLRGLNACLECATSMGVFAGASVVECRNAGCGRVNHYKGIPIGPAYCSQACADRASGKAKSLAATGSGREGEIPKRTLTDETEMGPGPSAQPPGGQSTAAEEATKRQSAQKAVSQTVAADSPKAKPWKAPTDGPPVRHVEPSMDKWLAEVASRVADILPMPLDTSRTMASREPRWRSPSYSDVRVVVDMDDSWLRDA